MPTPLFKTKTVKIDTLGEYLVTVRQQLNLDIKTVSLLTQIKPSYLQDLEAANYPALPAEVYVRGFLKSLADFYHIKERILIDQYEKESGFDSIPKTILRQQENKWSLTPKRIMILISVGFGLLALSYVVIQIRSVLVPPVLVLTDPAEDMTVSGNSIVVTGRGEPGAEVFLNNQPVLTDVNGQFTENLILGGGLNVIEVLERNKFGKTSRIVRNITAQISNPQPVANARVSLTVNIGPSSAWVYLEADGVVIERGTMLAGSTKTVTAKNEIVLTSADAGSTQVIYDGKDLGKLGRPGEVVRNVQFSSQ